jgi:hypothetical protein
MGNTCLPISVTTAARRSCGACGSGTARQGRYRTPPSPGSAASGACGSCAWRTAPDPRRCRGPRPRRSACPTARHQCRSRGAHTRVRGRRADALGPWGASGVTPRAADDGARRRRRDTRAGVGWNGGPPSSPHHHVDRRRSLLGPPAITSSAVRRGCRSAAPPAMAGLRRLYRRRWPGRSCHGTRSPSAGIAGRVHDHIRAARRLRPAGVRRVARTGTAHVAGSSLQAIAAAHQDVAGGPDGDAMTRASTGTGPGVAVGSTSPLPRTA